MPRTNKPMNKSSSLDEHQIPAGNHRVLENPPFDDFPSSIHLHLVWGFSIILVPYIFHPIKTH